MTTLCPSSNDLLGLVNGSLSDSEADSLQLHLERCETCQNALQEIVADGDFWQSAAQNLSDVEAAGPGLERVVDELQHQSPEDAEQMGEAIELKLSFIDPPTEPGTIGRLKHYDILRVAGRGGMGIVVKAFDRTLRRVVAVKLLAPHLAGNGQARQRFVREGRSAAGICHEHVVTIHAVEESPPFIVMQYVKGETLEARIHRNGSLEVREAVRIAKQIAQGLAAAHTQGVVHRDIKPANILLENGVARVRITDFGLARAVDDASLTQSGVVAGTPQYMAPEQANGDAVDERADLFSLGSVLYTMLAGHAPFRATTTMGVLKRLCDHNARPIREINPEVPDWLVVMINRLHAKRPADRYQSAQEVADVLERGLAAMQNGAAPTVEFATTTSAAPDSTMAGDAAVTDGRASESVLVSAIQTPSAATGLNQAQPANREPVDFKRLVPKWLFRPLPLWMIFMVVGLCVTPFSPSAMVISAILATVWLIGSRFAPDRSPAEAESSDGSLQAETNAMAELRFDDFILVRVIRRFFEIAPTSSLGCLIWLAVWLMPAFVWASVFFMQEKRMRAGGTRGNLMDVNLQTFGVAFGVVACWLLISILWFRRSYSDGSPLFTRRSKWNGMLGTLGLAAIFAACGIDTWESDVARPAFTRTIEMRSMLATANSPIIVPNSMVRVEFEVAVDGMEVVIGSDDARMVTFSPAHHGVMVQVSEDPGIYEWRAMLKGEHIASGKVTLVAGQLAEIKVPRPTLPQLIAGRWESDPNRTAVDWGEGEENGNCHVEMEFEDDLATMAMSQSGPADHSQFSVRIDESVSPALIDLSLPDGQQMIGIAKFQAGRKSHFQMHSPYRATPIVPGTTMSAEIMGGSSDNEGEASPEGGMGFGSPGIATSSEPDRLLLCLTEASGLRPWEFQADEDRGHMVFALVRSRESGSLREKMALSPVQLATSHDMILESVQAWSKKLKIEAEGTNSVGMKMVLVPPAAYHLVDQPQLSKLREVLELVIEEMEQNPQYVFEFPPKVKDQIRRTQKSVSYPFVMSRRLVTIDQFRTFVDETGYVTDAERGTTIQQVVSGVHGGYRRENRAFKWADGLSWRNEKADLEDSDGLPVAVVSWQDASEFCKWLTEKEGRQYRLPKNEEWTAAMQLGAARKQLPSTNSDEPSLHDYYGWFDATSKHPLGINQTDETFAEWTQDAQFGSKPDRMVLVHHEESADGVRFYLGTQFTADKSFRATSIGFRVVAELQVLAAEKPTDEEATSPAPEVSE